MCERFVLFFSRPAVVGATGRPVILIVLSREMVFVIGSYLFASAASCFWWNKSSALAFCLLVLVVVFHAAFKHHEIHSDSVPASLLLIERPRNIFIHAHMYGFLEFQIKLVRICHGCLCVLMSPPRPWSCATDGRPWNYYMLTLLPFMIFLYPEGVAAQIGPRCRWTNPVWQVFISKYLVPLSARPVKIKRFDIYDVMQQTYQMHRLHWRYLVRYNDGKGWWEVASAALTRRF